MKWDLISNFHRSFHLRNLQKLSLSSHPAHRSSNRHANKICSPPSPAPFLPPEQIKNKTGVSFLTSHSVEQAWNLSSRFPLSFITKEKGILHYFLLVPVKQSKSNLFFLPVLCYLSCFTCCLYINPNKMTQLFLVVSLPLGIFTVSYPPVILIYSGLIHPVTLVEWLVTASHMYPAPAPKVLVIQLTLSCPGSWDVAWCCLLPTSPVLSGDAAILHKHTQQTNTVQMRHKEPLSLVNILCYTRWVELGKGKWLEHQSPTVPALRRFGALLWVVFVQLSFSRVALCTQATLSPGERPHQRSLSSGTETTPSLDFFSLSRASECNFSY